MDTQDLSAELLSAIQLHLDLCDATETPTLCSMMNDKEGKEKVIKMVTDRVLIQKMEIPEAITSIEVEFDRNTLD